MKPRIFLSHSSKDKPFIEYLSGQLRKARIDCWYDDWEIPPGESIRRKIFEDGIPNCDVFFVYLTENSINSYWVQKELDSTVTIESENNDALLIPFVDKEEIREQLSVDLRSRNIPVINNDVFVDSIIRLTARAWEIFNKKALQKQKESQLTAQTQLKNQLLEAENKILPLQLTGNVDIEGLHNKLSSIKYKYGEVEKSLEDIFKHVILRLGSGANIYNLSSRIGQLFQFAYDSWGNNKVLTVQEKFDRELWDIMGTLVILGLVDRLPGNEHVSEEYSLTSVGIRLANQYFNNYK